MPALTETEARARAALIAVDSYDVFVDLTADPVRSRTEIRFTCAEPGAATFAELAATAAGAVLNGREILGPGAPAGGRLALARLAAENTLVAEAEVAADALARLPAGWECLANGPVTSRPPASQGGGAVAVRPGRRHAAVRHDDRGRALRCGCRARRSC